MLVQTCTHPVKVLEPLLGWVQFQNADSVFVCALVFLLLGLC